MAKEYKADQVIERNVVSMEFDNKKFNTKVKETEKSLKSLKKEMSFEDTDTSAAEKALDKIAVKFDWLKTVAETAIYRITNTAITAGEKMVKALSIDNIASGYEKYTQKVTAVQTMMAADTSLSIEQINEQMKKLEWFTDETSYNLSAMQGNMAKFMASGMKMEDAASVVEGMALWAAEAGQNAQTASNAMYQMSQAAGRGVVKWQDWMSIVTANMSTEGIQNRLIEAGKEMGTITGSAASKSFQELMAKGAFTTEVFTKVMKDYTEFADYIYVNKEDGETTATAIERIGSAWEGAADDGKAFSQTAFEAAQVAKTFKEVFESVKTAVATGWSQSLEQIIGGYEVVKTQMTDVSDILWEIFNGSAETRNATLTEWAGLEQGGRNDLWQGFKDLLTSILQIVEAFKEAWDNVFGEFKAETLAKIVKKFADWAAALKNNEKFFKRLTTLFELFLRVAKLVVSILKVMWAIIEPILNIALEIADAIAGVLIDLLGAQPVLFDLGDGASKFKDSTEAIKTAIDGVIAKFKEFGQGIDNWFTDVTGKSFKDWCSDIVAAFKKVLEVVGGFFAALFGGKGSSDVPTEDEATEESFTERLKNYTGTFGDALTGFLGMVLDKLKPLIDAIDQNLPHLASILESLTKLIIPLLNTVISFVDKFLEWVAAGDIESIARVALMIAGVIYLISDVMGIKEIVSIARNVKWMLQSIQQRLNVSSIRTLATALVEIAAAMWIFSKVDWDVIKKEALSFLVVTVVIGAIISAIIIIMNKLKDISAKKIDANWKTFLGFAALIMAFGVAMMAAAVAIKVISELNQDNVLKASLIVGAITVLLGVFALLAGRVKLFAGLGLLGLVGALALIALFMQKLADMAQGLNDMVAEIDKMSWAQIGSTYGKLAAILAGFIILIVLATKLMTIKGTAMLIVLTVGIIHLLKNYADVLVDLQNVFQSIVDFFKNNFGTGDEKTVAASLDSLTWLIIAIVSGIMGIFIAIGIMNKLTLKDNAKSLAALSLVVLSMGAAVAGIILSISLMMKMYNASTNQNGLHNFVLMVGIIIAILTFLVLSFTAMIAIISKSNVSAKSGVFIDKITGLIAVMALVIVAIVASIVGLMEAMVLIQRQAEGLNNYRSVYALLWNATSAIVALMVVIGGLVITLLVLSNKYSKTLTDSVFVKLSGLLATTALLVIAIMGGLAGLMEALAHVQGTMDGLNKYRNVYSLLWQATGAISLLMGEVSAFIDVLFYQANASASTNPAILDKVMGIMAMTALLMAAIIGGLAGLMEAMVQIQGQSEDSGHYRNVYALLWNATAAISTILAVLAVFVGMVLSKAVTNLDTNIGVMDKAIGLIAVMALLLMTVVGSLVSLITAITSEQIMSKGYNPYGLLWNSLLVIEIIFNTLAVFMTGMAHLAKSLDGYSMMSVATPFIIIAAGIAILVGCMVELVQALAPIYGNWAAWGMLIATFEIVIGSAVGIFMAMQGLARLSPDTAMAERLEALTYSFVIVSAAISILVTAMALLVIAMDPILNGASGPDWAKWSMLIATFGIVIGTAIGLFAALVGLSHITASTDSSLKLIKLAAVFAIISGAISGLVLSMAGLAVALEPVYGDWGKWSMLITTFGALVLTAAGLFTVITLLSNIADNGLFVSDMVAISLAFAIISVSMSALVVAFTGILHAITNLTAGEGDKTALIDKGVYTMWQISLMIVVMMGAVAGMAAVLGNAKESSIGSGLLAAGVLMGLLTTVVVAMAGALWVCYQILATTDANGLWATIGAISTLITQMGGLIGEIIGFIAIAKSGDKIDMASMIVVFAGITTILLAIMALFAVLANSFTNGGDALAVGGSIAIALQGVVSVILAITLAIMALSKVFITGGGVFSQPRMNAIITTIALISGLIVTLAVFMWAVSLAAANMTTESGAWGVSAAIAVLGGVLVGIMYSLVGLSKTELGSNLPKMKTLIGGLTVIMLAMSAFSLALAKVGESMNTEQLTTASGLIMTALAAIFGMISNKVSDIKTMSSTTGMIVGIILAAALALDKFSDLAFNMQNVDYGKMSEATLALGGLIAGIFGLAMAISAIITSGYGGMALGIGIAALAGMALVIDMIASAVFKLAWAIDALNVAISGGDSSLVREYSKLGEAWTSGGTSFSINPVLDLSNSEAFSNFDFKGINFNGSVPIAEQAAAAAGGTVATNNSTVDNSINGGVQVNVYAQPGQDAKEIADETVNTVTNYNNMRRARGAQYD